LIDGKKPLRTRWRHFGVVLELKTAGREVSVHVQRKRPDGAGEGNLARRRSESARLALRRVGYLNRGLPGNWRAGDDELRFCLRICIGKRVYIRHCARDGRILRDRR